MFIKGKIPQTDLDIINQRLIDIYGSYVNKPRYRIVFSEDEIEKRRSNISLEGFQLPDYITIEVPKYRQWIQEKYLLEQLTIVESIELLDKISYEPLFVFEDSVGHPLYPKWEVCRIVIENVLENIRTAGMYQKYKDPLANEDNKEIRKAELNKIYDELFANETKVGDALAHKEGVVVP